MIHIDDCMTFLISDHLSVLGSDIRPKADEWSGMKKAMLWSFYHTLGISKHFWKLMNYNVILFMESPGKRGVIYARAV